MTAKYKEIWDEEGAVDPSIGAKRVVHEIARLGPELHGKVFVLALLSINDGVTNFAVISLFVLLCLCQTLVVIS